MRQLIMIEINQETARNADAELKIKGFPRITGVFSCSLTGIIKCLWHMIRPADSRSQAPQSNFLTELSANEYILEIPRDLAPEFLYGIKLDQADRIKVKPAIVQDF